jgi:hypothetical protein
LRLTIAANGDFLFFLLFRWRGREADVSDHAADGKSR